MKSIHSCLPGGANWSSNVLSTKGYSSYKLHSFQGSARPLNRLLQLRGHPLGSRSSDKKLSSAIVFFFKLGLRLLPEKSVLLSRSEPVISLFCPTSSS